MARKNPVKKKKRKRLALPFSADAPEAKELPLAYMRINGAPARRLRWLLDFAYLDLDSLSEGRFADLRWEVVVFGLNKKPDQMKDEFEIFLELSSLTMPLTLDRDRLRSKEYQHQRLAESKKGAPPELLREFQNTMRNAFDQLFKPEWWEVTRPTAVERIALDIKTPDNSRYAQNPPAFTGHDLLLMQAIDLIKAERQRLKICQNPNCRKRFVAAKKGRAFFHSPKCSAYVRVNKARGKM
jgi:predicted RNA-binding Zn ribbon-like protein